MRCSRCAQIQVPHLVIFFYRKLFDIADERTLIKCPYYVSPRSTRWVRTIVGIAVGMVAAGNVSVKLSSVVQQSLCASDPSSNVLSGIEPLGAQ
jgi:hypothetical protein